MRKSRIHRDVAEKGIATCAKSNFSDPRIVEMAGLVGFSSIWLCQEHVPTDWKDIENAVRAGKIHDLDVIVRVAKGSYSDYIKPFECDAAGIMVPHVTSAEEAQRVVEICRFRPLGNRPLDGGNIDGEFCRRPLGKYLEASNREKIIILQIESPEAVEVVEEIAAVEGYDYLLFGPGDYAHRINKAGQIHDAEVLEARARVEAATLKYGKRGFAVGAQGSPSELIARGYSLVNLTSDVGALSQAWDQVLTTFQKNAQDSGAYYAR